MKRCTKYVAAAPSRSRRPLQKAFFSVGPALRGAPPAPFSLSDDASSVDLAPSSCPEYSPMPDTLSSAALAGCPSSLSVAIMPIAATFSLRFSVSSRSFDALRSTIICKGGGREGGCEW